MDEATRVAKLVIALLFGHDATELAPKYGAASTAAVRDLLEREAWYGAASTAAVRDLLEREAWKAELELAGQVVALTEERDALRVQRQQLREKLSDICRLASAQGFAPGIVEAAHALLAQVPQ